MANSLAHIRRVCKCHIVFKLSVICLLRPGSLPVKVKQAEKPVWQGWGYTSKVWPLATGSKAGIGIGSYKAGSQSQQSISFLRRGRGISRKKANS